MRTSHLYTISSFIGLLALAGICYPVKAQAQDTSLSPQTDWSLSKIEKGSRADNAYCTISRNYQDGPVLSIARNKTDEYSIAIDFQDQVFEADKALKINLQPGPGKFRAYDLMPTSKTALVVRLGWDEGFMDELTKSGTLKVKIGDESYAFAVPGMHDGHAKLKTCSMQLAAAAKPSTDQSPPTDVLAATATPPVAGFDAKRMEAAPELQAMKAETADQERKILKEFAANMMAQEGMSQDTQDAPKRRSNFNKDKEEDLLPSETEPSSKEPAIAPKEEAKDQTPPPNAVALNDQTPAAGEDKTIASLKQEIARLSADNKTLQERLKAEKDRRKELPDEKDVQETLERMKVVEIKNAQLEESLRQAQVRIAETAANTQTRAIKQITELEEKLTAAQKDNAVLAKKLDDMALREKNAGLLSTVAGDWDLEKATKRYNEAQNEIRRMALQIEDQKKLCSQEKANIEKMLFDPAIAEREQIEKVSALQSRIKDLETQVSDKAALVQAQINQQVLEKTKGFEQEKASLQQKVSQLEAEIAAVSKPISIEAEQSALKKTQAQDDAAQAFAQEKQALEKTIAELRADLAQKDAALKSDAPRRDLEAAEQAMMESLRADNQKLRSDVERLAAALDEQYQKTVVAAKAAQPVTSNPSAMSATKTNDIKALSQTEPSSGTSTGGIMGTDDLRSLLENAGLSPGAITKLNKGMASADSYGWNTPLGVTGRISVSSMPSKNAFEAMIGNFIEYERGRCAGGDFASMVTPGSPPPKEGVRPMALYELACVSPGQSLAASILFFEYEGKFIAIAGDSSPDRIDTAIDARDRLANYISAL